MKSASFLLLSFCLLSVPALRADVVETRDGARLTGTITGVLDGKITLETAYAGTLEIDSAQVVAFSTDEPVFVRLASGNTMAGAVGTTADGRMKIQSEDGVMTTDISRVSMSWRPGDKDPMLAIEDSKRRKWSYTAAVNVSGKGGNSDESNIGLRGSATLQGPDDKLVFYGSYRRAEKNSETTDDETIGGFRYESFVAGDWGWYLRGEAENDEFENLDLRTTAGGGLTYRFINQENNRLTGRFGAAYRYQSFIDGSDSDDLTVDIGLSHDYTWNDYWSLDTEINLNPAVNDFGNFVLKHDSVFVVPIPNTFWAVGLGFGNDYNSEPPAGVDEWDYRYYASLILNFGD